MTHMYVHVDYHVRELYVTHVYVHVDYRVHELYVTHMYVEGTFTCGSYSRVEGALQCSYCTR